MRRIVISAGIGIVAAGVLALPVAASAASAAPSAAGKSASPFFWGKSCGEAVSEMQLLDQQSDQAAANLRNARRQGNQWWAWYYNRVLNSISDQIAEDRSILDKCDADSPGQGSWSPLPGSPPGPPGGDQLPPGFPAWQPPGSTPPGWAPVGSQPPGNQPPGNQPPGNQPPGNQ
jgi:hypothetical protein